MKAVVLAAGRGERLVPLTETRPKHLLPVGGVPLLDRSLRGLVGAGVEEVLLVTHYMEERIREHFGDGSGLGLEISYARQEEMRGTADAFRIAEGFVGDEEFLGFYGDLYVDPGCFETLIGAHRRGETTLCAVPVEDPSQIGALRLDGDRVTDVVEKPAPGEAPSNLGNAGIYVFTSEIFRFIKGTGLSSRSEYELTDSIKALIESGSTVRAVTIPEEGWLDVGLPWNLLDANERALGLMEASVEGEVEEGVSIQGPVKICEGARVRAGAYVEGPAYIGPGSDIGPNCYIRPATSIGANVRIGNACEVKNSIVMDGTHIAHLSYVGDSIIGEGCNLGAGTITANIRFDKKNIKVNIKGRPLDSGRRKLGTIMGDDVQTGINVNLMPGVKVGSGAWIEPGLTVYDDIPSGVFMRAEK
ncbi:MAG: sugar phosphate nucleotidyltransferase [Candidatus Bathyarchaeota archaeon]|nr:sugar phosphate nucleotidyltransferase [Candidatus Bathyarchaeota archaeon]